MAQWYFKKNNQKVGPLNDAQMRQVARDGMLQPSDQVWRDGLKEWVPAVKIKGLFPAAEGLSAMATIQEPLHQGMQNRAHAQQSKAAPVKPQGPGLPTVEVFDVPPAQATRLPTVMGKPIGSGHKITIVQPQHQAAPASKEEPYEPPPLPPTEEPASPAKSVKPAAKATPARPAVAPQAAPEPEEEPVKVEQEEEDDFLGGFKEEMAGSKTGQAIEEPAEAEAGKDMDEVAEKALQQADQAEPSLSEKDFFPSEAQEGQPQSPEKPALAAKPSKSAKPSKPAKPQKKAKASPESPDEETGPAGPDIGLALAACVIGLLAAAPAGLVFWLSLQAGAAGSSGSAAQANQSIVDSYRTAIEHQLPGGLDSIMTDWRVLIGLSGVLTFLVGLLALLIKSLRKMAVAIFILLALAGLAGHVVVFQIPVCIAKPDQSVQAATVKPVPRPAAKIQPTSAQSETPIATPASQPRSAPATAP